MSIIPEHFLNAAVTIGVEKDGTVNWVGTGFFVVRNLGTPGVGIPYLVTNRHVVEGKHAIVLRMVDRTNGHMVNVPASLEDESGRQYLVHPNPSIDVAVLPLNAEFIQQRNLAHFAFDIDAESLGSFDLRSEGFDEGSVVYMLGFPLGLVNEGSPMPICRMGCVARIDESQISETGNFLIDIQNFPGNSGSPIVSRAEIVSIGNTKSLSRCVLAGIIHSYIPYQVPLIDAQTGRTVELREENSGLAHVHPVEYIQEVIDQVQQRFEDPESIQDVNDSAVEADESEDEFCEE